MSLPQPFEAARMVLDQLIGDLTFCRLERGCTIPDKERDAGLSIAPLGGSYFHGTGSQRLWGAQTGRRPRQVWFNRNTRRREGLFIGPARIPSSSGGHVPSPGSTLVGLTQQSSSRGARWQYAWWCGGAEPLWKLGNAIRNGTALTEQELRTELHLDLCSGGEDDLFALARLVLYGNVTVFAHQAMGYELQEPPMSLSCGNAYEFVCGCAHALRDPSIYHAFMRVYREPMLQPRQPSIPPQPSPPSPPQLSGLLPSAFTAFGDGNNLVMTQLHALAEELTVRRSQPPSPPYCPTSPPPSPSSPPYCPTSPPPPSPSSPPYCPFSPPPSPSSSSSPLNTYDPSNWSY